MSTVTDMTIEQEAPAASAAGAPPRRAARTRNLRPV